MISKKGVSAPVAASLVVFEMDEPEEFKHMFVQAVNFVSAIQEENNQAKWNGFGGIMSLANKP